ncbi:KAP family P-loop domain-containing protein [Amycolatopsis tolypomycina]|uniref:KAP family P-loop domain-containing protein n=1 Tax=Amycolatopsis tolypomycina TaxID=208445 RepID=A0A1H4PFY7_9PSEU|nr:KAP family P-loop domain-containing protein [Amycolatopsis tolypomycina]
MVHPDHASRKFRWLARLRDEIIGFLENVDVEPVGELAPSVLLDWDSAMAEGFELWTARLALEVMLDESLAREDIKAALRAEAIRAEDAKRAVMSSETALARVRMAQDEYARRADSAQRPSRLSDLTPAKIGWLFVAGVLCLGYVAVLAYCGPQLTVGLSAMSLVGLAGVALFSGSIVQRHVPKLLPFNNLREIGRMVPHEDLIGLGSRWQAVQTELVIPEIREFIRRNRVLVYGGRLIFQEIHGLYGEAESDIVQTAGTRRLARVLSRADSVAVALAGHRGVGKTTAIRSIARGLHTSPGSPAPFVVVASAPANYEARDFVLHLHALLCRAVLDRVGSPRPEKGGRLRAAALRIVLGLVFIFACADTALLLWNTDVPRFGADIAGLIRRSVAGFPNGVDRLWAGQPPVHLVALAVLALIPLVVIGWLLVSITSAIAGIPRRRRLRGLAVLQRQTRKQLDQIRFLQTYTTGWSGKLSMPLKGEAGRTWSTQRAEQQLTHPEVVDKFREFAAFASRRLQEEGVSEHHLIIAIDELDKIGEPEKAYQFINDIKAIFDVPGCLFFVSVSDDAVLNFEQRGLAVRDAFDSAFSEMIRLEHFTMDESRLWIALRLIGLPEQFGCLCHCVSGGLPRDLKRYTIEMIDMAAAVYRPSLAQVARAFVARELQSKAHALAGVASALPPTAELAELTGLILQIRQMREPAELAQFATRVHADEAEVDLADPVTRLRSQAACFALFCATVLEVFTDELDEPELTADLHMIAVTRQRMAFYPHLAMQTIVDFRQRFGLDTESAG